MKEQEEKSAILKLLYCVAMSDGLLSISEEEALAEYSDEYNSDFTVENCNSEAIFKGVSGVKDHKDLLSKVRMIIEADGYLKKGEMDIFSTLYERISSDKSSDTAQ